MSLAELAYKELQRLPQPMVQEVIDFIGYLEQKHGIDDSSMIATQTDSLSHIWENSEDSVWDDYKPV